MDQKKKNTGLKTACRFCGNNPVPHRLYWYNESLNILLTPLRQKVLYNRFTGYIKKKAWDQKVSLAALAAAERLKIISRQNDRTKCAVRRAQVLWEEADKRGIKMSELLIFGKPFDTYAAVSRRLSAADSTILFSGLPRPEGYSNPLLDLMDDKWLFKQIMMERGLPVPKGGSATNFSQARKIFREIQQSAVSSQQSAVIVKPRAGSRGRHTTTFVRTEKDLAQAFKIAKQLCHWVIIERQIFGPVYRGAAVNFETVGVLRGDPPTITGDGNNTISQLADIKNQALHPGVKNIATDEAAELFLSRQGLGLQSVPKAGETVNLSEKIGVNYGGSSAEEFDVCHPDNLKLFEQAARALGDPLVGFDFIIPDIAQSYKNQICGFIEVNSLPFINLHHDPLLGRPRDVAAKVWQMAGM